MAPHEASSSSDTDIGASRDLSGLASWPPVCLWFLSFLLTAYRSFFLGFSLSSSPLLIFHLKSSYSLRSSLHLSCKFLLLFLTELRESWRLLCSKITWNIISHKKERHGLWIAEASQREDFNMQVQRANNSHKTFPHGPGCSIESRGILNHCKRKREVDGA